MVEGGGGTADGWQKYQVLNEYDCVLNLAGRVEADGAVRRHAPYSAHQGDEW